MKHITLEQVMRQVIGVGIIDAAGKRLIKRVYDICSDAERMESRWYVPPTDRSGVEFCKVCDESYHRCKCNIPSYMLPEDIKRFKEGK